MANSLIRSLYTEKVINELNKYVGYIHDFNFCDDFDPIFRIDIDNLQTYESRALVYEQHVNNKYNTGIRRTGSMCVQIPDVVILASFEYELRKMIKFKTIQKYMRHYIHSKRLTMYNLVKFLDSNITDRNVIKEIIKLTK